MEFFQVETWSQETYTYVGEFASKFIFLFLFFSLSSQSKKVGKWLYIKMLGTKQLETRIYLAPLSDSLLRVAVFVLVSVPQMLVAGLFIWIVWQQPFQIWIFCEIHGFFGFFCKLFLLLSLWTWQQHLLHGFRFALAQMVFRWITLYGVFISATAIINHLDTWARKTQKKIISHGQAIVWLCMTNSIVIFLFWLRTGGPIL